MKKFLRKDLAGLVPQNSYQTYSLVLVMSYLANFLLISLNNIWLLLFWETHLFLILVSFFQSIFIVPILFLYMNRLLTKNNELLAIENQNRSENNV